MVIERSRNDIFLQLNSHLDFAQRPKCKVTIYNDSLITFHKLYLAIFFLIRLKIFA